MFPQKYLDFYIEIIQKEPRIMTLNVNIHSSYKKKKKKSSFFWVYENNYL